jgi:CDP-4-dehydro-6-deoxyglucose reductase, E1
MVQERKGVAMRWPLMGETITYMDRLKMAYFTLTAKKFTFGEKVEQFENEWSEWLGAKHSLFVSSGSTANFLLIAAVKELYGLKNGDKVLVPACTWMTNVAPIMQLGLEPIFCDIEFDDFSFDLSEARKIAKKHDIKLVFITHLLGFSADNEGLKKIFPKALFLDDVCESHGCTDPIGNKRGSDSLGATFSFYFGHHMSTIEGGMVSTNNTDLYDLMKMKRSHGMARASTRFDDYAKAYPDIDKQFLFVTDGYNFRNHEICAVLGMSQLKRLDKMIAIRKRNHELFTDIIDSYPILFYNIKNPPTNSSFSFPFICRSPKIMKAMKEVFVKYGIEYRPVVAGNLLTQPFLKDYKIDTDRPVTNADIVNYQGVYVGNNHFVTEKDMAFLKQVVGEIFEKFR